MTHLQFGGSLNDLINALARILPPAPEGEGRWQGPRAVWGSGETAVERIMVEHGLSLGPSRKKTLLGEMRPGDCLVLLEPGQECLPGGFPIPSTPVAEGGGGVAQRPSLKWFLEFVCGVMSSGGCLVLAGNTWQAWERGPASIIARTLGESLPVSRTRPVSGFLHEKAYKVVVFVPRGYEDAVREAMAGEGAGHIGNYSHCTFQAAGQGTFLPLEGSNPFIGRSGELGRAEEWRLETVVRERSLKRVIEAMLKAHPYEEVAYDVFELRNARLALGTTLAVDFERPVRPEELLGSLERAGMGEDGRRKARGASGTDEIGDPLRRIAVSRFCGPEEVESGSSSGAGALVFVEDTYEGEMWRTRLGLPGIAVGRRAYEMVVKELCSVLESEVTG